MPATQALVPAFGGMVYVAASCPKSPRNGCNRSVAPNSDAGNCQNVTLPGSVWRCRLVARRLFDAPPGDAGAFVDMLDQRHEPVALERKREIGEHCSLN